MKLADHRSWLAGAVALSVVAAGATVATSAQAAATDCQVTYSVSSQSSGGFGANVDVTNASWNGALGTGGTASFGFNGSSGGANPVPTGFALNGVPCTGDTTGGGTATPPPPTTTAPAGRSLPSSFRWSSSGALIAPKSDATHSLIAVKDSSVLHFNGRWHMFASTVNASGNYSMEYLNFTDWSQAAAAPQSYLDQTAIGTGYKTAPQVFFFAPQKLWYLVYQTGSNASYSTNADIGNPAGWSAPHNFYSGMPAIIQQNIGSGFWVDFWVICDSANCYLFSADDNGHIYRSQTTLANFPNGFGDGSNTVIAASDTNRFNLFEAENVYKVDGSNTYLLIVEAIGSDGHRQFRSWTSPSLTGSWTPLTATQANPFAAASNITFTGTPWTQDISSGEAIRSGFNQNLTISPCHLQYAYQGVAPSSAGLPYNSLPWRIGLLTQTNPAC